MITAIIIDDDLLYANILREEVKLAAQQVHMDIDITIADTPLVCLESTQPYDIYFLDIVMPEFSGIDLVKRLRERYIDKEFIFVSSYTQYMRTSIFVKPRAYIRKEYLQSDLDETFSVLKSIFAKDKVELLIRDNCKNVRIKPQEITYLKSHEHYVNIYDKSGNMSMVRNTLKQLELQLKEHEFLRIHLRYLINMNYIEDYYKHKILMKNGEILPVSAPYSRRVSEVIMNWLMAAED